jgi:hypothetical protein
MSSTRAKNRDLFVTIVLALGYRNDIVEDLGLSLFHLWHLLLDTVDAHIEMEAVLALCLVEDEIAGSII